MTVTPLDSGTVFGGIDTHADTIHVGVIDPWGRELGDKEFPTTPSGYLQALEFLAGFGQVAAVGISRTERGKFITPEVVNRYRKWLQTA